MWVGQTGGNVQKPYKSYVYVVLAVGLLWIFTFSTASNTASILQYGLRLMLSPDLYEYIPAVTPGLGVRVSVHDPLTVPFPEDTGLNVAVNMRTSVRVSMVSGADWKYVASAGYVLGQLR